GEGVIVRLSVAEVTVKRQILARPHFAGRPPAGGHFRSMLNVFDPPRTVVVTPDDSLSANRVGSGNHPGGFPPPEAAPFDRGVIRTAAAAVASAAGSRRRGLMRSSSGAGGGVTAGR